MPTNVTPSTGPWQLSGTIFALDDLKPGTPVAGAQLVLTSGHEVRAKAVGDKSGYYVFNKLETGSFGLTISAPGFATLTPSINLNRDIQADFAINRH